MKIIISGGGTGGHIYPAVTIAKHIQRQCSEAEIVFVGTREGLERDIVPRYGFRLEFVEVSGFSRKLGLDTFKSLYKLCRGLLDAFRLLGKVRPELVIGTGGYVCGPVLFLAALRGIPTCIQEQNAMPGITNKILSYFVKEAFLGYAEAAEYLRGPAEKVPTGNPVRDEITEAERGNALQELGLDSRKKTILVSGGSRGAKTINEAMVFVDKKLAGREDVQVIHVTGENGYEEVRIKLEETLLAVNNIKLFPYLHEMPLAIAAADLAVFRAGAIGLAELAARGIPAILVPYPYATANHQEHNARAVEAAGAAHVILDSELTGEKLFEKLDGLLQDEQKLKKMQQAAKSLGRPEAAKVIAQKALALMKDRHEED